MSRSPSRWRPPSTSRWSARTSTASGSSRASSLRATPTPGSADPGRTNCSIGRWPDRAGGPVPQPLAGILVVDLTHALAGPFCTHQLQLLGADVVKVEPPRGGDDFRARPGIFEAVN